MVSEVQPVSKTILWAGYVITALSALFMLFSASGKFLKPEGIEANVIPLGWRMDQLTSLGILEVACTIIYVIPRTAVFGAVLLTAYLGGATATHVRIDEPYFFPVIVGIFVWLGIYLREPHLWDLAPLRK